MLSPFTPRLPAVVRRLLRGQRRSAATTLLIVLTLALALGANTAVLSVADALLLRAVPFADAARLVAVTSAFPGIRLTQMGLSGPEALEFSRLTHAFSAAGPYAFAGLVVEGGPEAELANGVEISRGAMAALSVTTVLGRGFSDDEYASGGRRVALLGYGLWTRAFGQDPAVVGRVVKLGGDSREIVGITAPGMTLLNRPLDVWLPLSISADNAGSRSDHRFNVVARIAPGRSFADAVSDVRRAMEVWREETGEMHVPTAKMHPLEIRTLTAATTGLTREPIAALIAAVAFVLLIACVNISNLLVARAEGARSDIAIQLALGATRRRLLGESVAEGLVLAGAGALGGLALSQVIVEAVRSAWPVAASANLSLDYRVAAIAAGLAAGTGLLIGSVPILRLDVTRANDCLKSAHRGGGGAGRLHLQRILIGFQVAIAVLLSASAGLMVRSLRAVTSIDSGIVARDVVRAQVSLPAGSYPQDAQVWSFYERVLERLRTMPGVTDAGIMSGVPPLRRANNTTFQLDGVETFDHTSMHQVDFVQHISPGYLATLGIRLLEGRELTAADTDRAAPAALVNETLAKKFWTGQSAIGHRLKPFGIGTWFTVVGVVADVRQAGVQALPAPEIYVTHRQARLLLPGFLPRTMNVVVRSDDGVAAVAAAIRSAVGEIEPAAAISNVAAMQTVIDRTIAQPRLLAWMFTGFAVVALVVAAMGVYAVTSYAVSARTTEFGIRMALGARPSDVVRLVLTAGLATMAAGVAAGALGALLAARLLRSLLFGVDALDPASLTMGAAVIFVSALAATLLPAGRAARVDPMIALRDS